MPIFAITSKINTSDKMPQAFPMTGKPIALNKFPSEAIPSINPQIGKGNFFKNNFIRSSPLLDELNYIVYGTINKIDSIYIYYRRNL